MPSVDHRINIILINELKLLTSIIIYVNDQIKIKQHFYKSGNYVLEFTHDYRGQAANVLKIQFQGQEQESKQLTLKEIIINGQQLNVNSGFYVPARNKWWNNLDHYELQLKKQKYLCHGGKLGWFGSIVYEYVDQKQPWRVTDPSLFKTKRIFL